MLEKDDKKIFLEKLKGFKIKKHFGQNFLVSSYYIDKISDHILESLNNIDRIIEIGPGFGFLTKPILDKIKKRNLDVKVIAIEKDNKICDYLRSTLKDYDNFELLEADALKSLEELQIENYKLVGNIPYYITKPLINKSLSLHKPPKEITFLIQKEVADKLVDKNKQNIFSLSVNLRGSPKALERINSTFFFPAPKVDSVLIRISHIKSVKNFESLMEIIKLGLSFKRKTLFNNLKRKIPLMSLENIFKELDLDKNIRGEDIVKEKWINIHNLINFHITNN